MNKTKEKQKERPWIWGRKRNKQEQEENKNKKENPKNSTKGFHFQIDEEKDKRQQGFEAGGALLIKKKL